MNLNYKVSGQGFPIITLHGLFGSLDNLQGIAKKLAENYMVFTIDQRNHGRSPHDPEMNYSLMAEDLRLFMEQQWIHKAVVMGHSMGGKTAIQFALDFPDMVEKLVVVDMSPFANNGEHGSIFKALMSLDLEKISSRNAAENLLATGIPDQPVRQFLLKNLYRDKQGAYHWRMNLSAIFENYESILAPVKVTEPFDGDTLFIGGGLSDYLREDEFKSILEIFPRAQFRTIENAGHWVHADQPERLIGEVRNFLKD